jgi:UDP-galactopyranose mutase
MTYDYLIVGAGLFGATTARLLTDSGKRCLVIERRDHIGGNCFDELIDGVYVNRYGGHIFHTNNERIWRFVNKYSEWIPYEHRVKAYSNGRVYSLPPNLMTLQQLGVSRDDPLALELIRNKFFVGYSVKQWGRPYSEIPESVTRRIPIRDNWDDRYYGDRYQAMPARGYTEFIANLLDGVDVELETDYLDDDLYWNRKAAQVIYSGQIDRYYGYDLGMLEYRSLKHVMFEAQEDIIGCATMNYPDMDVEYTRIMDWKYFGHRRTGGVGPITYEYPQGYDGSNEPYYPVPTEENRRLYRQYVERLKLAPWLHVGGRLGAYQYYDMHQAIGAAMTLVERLAQNG